MIIQDPEIKETNDSNKFEKFASQTPPKNFQGNTLYEFDAYLAYPHQRGNKWIYYMFGIVILMIVMSILTQSFFMALAFIALAAVYYFTHPNYANNEIRKVAITNMGVNINDKFTSFGELRFFYLVIKPEFANLIFVPNSAISGVKSIYFVNPEDILNSKNILKKYIKEQAGIPETFAHYIMRKLKL